MELGSCYSTFLSPYSSRIFIFLLITPRPVCVCVCLSQCRDLIRWIPSWWNAREGRSAHAPTRRIRRRNSRKRFFFFFFLFKITRGIVCVWFFIWHVSPTISPIFFCFHSSDTFRQLCCCRDFIQSRNYVPYFLSFFVNHFPPFIFGVSCFGLEMFLRGVERERETTVIATRLTLFTVSWFSMRLEWNLRVWWGVDESPNCFLFSSL